MGNIGNIFVPPEGDPKSRIWIIGEAPGEEEEEKRRPFVGRSGQLLEDTLLRYGIRRQDVYLTNLCGYRPRENKFELLLNSSQLRDGISSLLQLLREFQPHLVVPLGSRSLRVTTGYESITKYRGSILPFKDGESIGSKVVPTYHPSYVLRSAGEYPTFAADIKRIRGELDIDGLAYTRRDYYIAPEFGTLEELVYEFENAPILACDIEAIKESKRILCHGFAVSKHKALVLPNTDYFQPYIHRLYSCKAQKIFHFGMYDSSMLLENGYNLVNYTHDTFTLAHCLEPELPHGLDWLTSIYTREPYYKSEGRAEIPDNTKAWSEKTDPNKLYIYNAKDCCCTYEIFDALMAELETDEYARNMYEYEMSINPIALDIGRVGLLVDEEKQAWMKAGLIERIGKLGMALNAIAGKVVNVNSKKDMPWLLYEKFKLPVRRKREGGVTTDEDAIVSLLTHVTGKIETLKTEKAQLEWMVKKEALKLILEIRGLRKVISSYININLENGRAKSTYCVSGTETGRWSAMKYVGGLGFNAMTMPREALEFPENPKVDFDEIQWYLDSIKNDPEEEDAA